jgi:hypothetical protein
LERYESVGACEALEFCSQRLAELEGAGACQLYCRFDTRISPPSAAAWHWYRVVDLNDSPGASVEHEHHRKSHDH